MTWVQVPVYAEPDALAAAVGLPSGNDEKLIVALVLASRWVDEYLGRDGLSAADEYDFTDDAWYEASAVTVLECPAAVRLATIAAGVRFLKSPDVPWGVAGGLGDMAVYVKTRMPEVELMLMGLRESWGIA